MVSATRTFSAIWQMPRPLDSSEMYSVPCFGLHLRMYTSYEMRKFVFNVKFAFKQLATLLHNFTLLCRVSTHCYRIHEITFSFIANDCGQKRYETTFERPSIDLS